MFNIPNLSPDINKQLDSVIPVNPLTGLRDNLVHKYEISLSQAEKAKLEQYIEVQDYSAPSHQLSDKELIALCPSRFVQTLSDTKALVKAMRTVVDRLDTEDKRSSVDPEYNSPSVDNPSSEAASQS